MTRTARSVYPNALIKDRSVSKSGADKALKKNGAGPHNWGNPLVDYAHEAEDTEDPTFDDEAPAALPASAANGNGSGSADADADKTSEPSTSPSAPTPKAMAPAGASTGALDIANGKGKTGRKMSLSEEEREEARRMRHGAMKGDHVDLTNIARSSAAVSHSPPMDNGLSTSPVRNMNVLAKNLGKY